MLNYACLHCPEDDSHVVIATSEMVCEESVQVGDKVKFYYNNGKKKKLWNGVLKAMSDDYEEMRAKADELNKLTRPKREASFHADRERRAKKSKKDRSRSPSAKKTQKLKSASRDKSSTRKDCKSERGKDSKKSAESGKASKPESGKASKPESGKACKPESGKASKPESGKASQPESGTDLKNSVSAKACRDEPETSSKPQPNNEDASPDLAILTAKGMAPHEGSDEAAAAMVTDESDSNSSPEMTAEDQEIYRKLQAKYTNCDLNLVKANGKSTSAVLSKDISQKGKPVVSQSSSGSIDRELSKPGTSSGSSNSAVLDSDGTFEAGPSGSGGQPKSGTLIVNSSDSSDTSTSESSGDDAPPPSKNQKVSRKVLLASRLAKKKNVENIVFTGEQFAYRKNQLDPKDPNTVVTKQLHSGFEVYIHNSEVRDLKKLTSATALARAALRAVFTAGARQSCSVSGKPAPEKNGVVEVRTALDPNGVNAIIDYVKARAVKKRWPIPDETKLKQAMGNALCEERALARLSQELAAAVAAEQAAAIAQAAQPDPAKEAED